METFFAVVAVAIGWMALHSKDKPPPVPPPSPAITSTDAGTEAFLQRWVKSNLQLKDLRYSCKVERLDRQFMQTTQTDVVWIKSGPLRIDFKDRSNRLSDIFLYDETAFTNYQFNSRTKHAADIALLKQPTAGGFWGRYQRALTTGPRDTFWQIPFRDLRSHFHAKLYKEDRDCFYLRMSPRTAEDKADMQEAFMAIEKGRLLARAYLVDEPNGNRVIYYFENVCINAIPPITREAVLKGIPRDFAEFIAPSESSDEKSAKPLPALPLKKMPNP